MASPAQITANRANAEHSTGPTSADGKKRSSRNSTRHGLFARDLYIPEELRPEFDSLRADLLRDLCPGTSIEVVLFNQILSASWKLFRCDRAEAQLDTLVSTAGLEPLLDPALEPQLRTLERARGQANKSLHKAITELRRIQTERQYREAQMPECAGFDTRYAGLASWQTIRARIRVEGSTMARYNAETEAEPDNGPAELEELYGGPDYSAGLDCLDIPFLPDYLTSRRPAENQPCKTNPIPAAPQPSSPQEQSL
jgi:hypothetical protein